MYWGKMGNETEGLNRPHPSMHAIPYLRISSPHLTPFGMPFSRVSNTSDRGTGEHPLPRLAKTLSMDKLSREFSPSFSVTVVT